MYVEITYVFFKLGLLSFGGPAAHIALMHQVFVDEKKWLDEKHFLDLISLASVIPGPSSTELALLIGRHRGGKLGLWLAGAAFICPALVLVLALAYVYIEFGELLVIQSMLTVIAPVIVSIILYAVYQLSKKMIKSYDAFIYIPIAFVLSVRMNPVIVFLIIGLLAFTYQYLFRKTQVKEGISIILIFFLFFQIGATLYGSGYVLTSYLESLFVQPGHLTLQQMLDGIAVGQITPGPVFTTAGFLGYILSGHPLGGIVGAIGIFLPGFLLITFFYKGFEYLREAHWFSYILKALNYTAIALMVSVSFQLGLSFEFLYWKYAVIFIGFCLLMIKLLTPSKLIFMAAMLGIIISIV
jgi:chromate transporter